MQYLNLIGEMAKRKVKNESIAQELGIHRNSVYNKLNGESSFSVDEAIRIRDTFFPGYDIKYLFLVDVQILTAMQTITLPFIIVFYDEIVGISFGHL